MCLVFRGYQRSGRIGIAGDPGEEVEAAVRVIKVSEPEEARAQLAQRGTEVDLMEMFPARGQDCHRGLGQGPLSICSTGPWVRCCFRAAITGASGVASCTIQPDMV